VTVYPCNHPQVLFDHLAVIQTQRAPPQPNLKQETWKKILEAGQEQDMSSIRVETSQELLDLAWLSFAWYRNRQIEYPLLCGILSRVNVKALGSVVPCFTERPAGARRDVVVDFQSCLAFVFVQEMKCRETDGEMRYHKIMWARAMTSARVLLPKTLHRFGEAILHEVAACTSLFLLKFMRPSYLSFLAIVMRMIVETIIMHTFM
jgi:hypothetical protein